MLIYSTLTTASPIPSTIVPICEAITNIFRDALGQGPHPTMVTQKSALVQSTTSVQSPISIPKVSHSPPFNANLDPTDREFPRKKVEECKIRQGKVLVEEGKVNAYTKIIAVLEQSQREGMGTALTEPLRKQLQADSEKRVSAGRRKGILQKFLGMPSPTPSAGSPEITTLPGTVPSTTSIDVVVSPALPTPSVQSPEALEADSL